MRVPTLPGTGMLQAVAAPTRRLHPCRMCRAGDRQQTSTVAFVAAVALRAIRRPPFAAARKSLNRLLDEAQTKGVR